MGKPTKPRSGSMGVWPRKRAKRQYARVRHFTGNENKLLGFAGYKAGMTHMIVKGQDKNKMNAGLDTFTPVTIIECPPVKIASARFYKDGVVSKQINFKVEKELQRKTNLPKKSNSDELSNIKPEDFDDVTVQIYTLPKLIDLKKTPEIFEVPIGGSVEEKLNFIKENKEKQISIKDVFKEGSLVDTHSITKGKGFQGPVKRFGIGLTSHKAEKARRNPGSLGGWTSQAHVMYRVPHAGQMGYHQRTQFNNQILKISDDPKEVNPKGGLVRYGEVKSTFILLKGSLPGPKKRLITLTHAYRPKKVPAFSPESIKYINVESQQ